MKNYYNKKIKNLLKKSLQGEHLPFSITIIEYFIIFIFIFVPLTYNYFFSNQFILKKFILSLFLLFIILFYLFSFLLDYKNYSSFIKIKLNLLDIFILLFFINIYISFFINKKNLPSYSLLFFYISLLILYIFLKINKNIKKIYNIIFSITFFLGITLTLYGLIEYSLKKEDFFSTFGNSNFAGSFISIFLIIFFLYNIPLFSFNINLAIKVLISPILISYLLILKCRAAWISFLFSIILLIILYFFKKKDKKVDISTILNSIFIIKKYIFISFFISLMCFFILFYNKDHNIIKRIKSLKNFNKGSVKVRLLIWKSTLKIIKNNPLGVGLNNFSICYYKNRTPKEYILSNGRIVNHPHNTYLLIFCENGIISGFIFIFIIIYSIIYCVKFYYKDYLFYIILGIIINFSIFSLFNSPIIFPSSSIFIFLCFAYISTSSSNFIEFSINKNLKIISIILIFIFYSYYFITISAAELLGEFYFSKAQKLIKNNKFFNSEKYLKKSITFFQSGYYTIEYSRILFYLQKYNLAKKYINQTIEIAPYIENSYILLGIIYIKEKRYNKGIKIWEKALKYFFPSKIILYNLIEIYINLNNYKKSEKYLKILQKFYLNIEKEGRFLIYQGEIEEFKGNLKKALLNYIKAKEIMKNNGYIYLRIGVILWKIGLENSALTNILKAVDKGDINIKYKALCTLGNIYENNKKLKSALIYYIRAAQLKNNNPLAYLYIMQIAFKLRKKKIALKYFYYLKNKLKFKKWSLLKNNTSFIYLWKKIKNIIKK